MHLVRSVFACFRIAYLLRYFEIEENAAGMVKEDNPAVEPQRPQKWFGGVSVGVEARVKYIDKVVATRELFVSTMSTARTTAVHKQVDKLATQ